MADEYRRASSLRDIAEAAGVSIRTVSRVLKGTGSASAAARERVMATAERMGYRPNLVARALRTGRTMEVGVVTGTQDGETGEPRVAILFDRSGNPLAAPQGVDLKEADPSSGKRRRLILGTEFSRG